MLRTVTRPAANTDVYKRQAWEAALESLDADIESLSAFAGKLSDAVTIGAYLDASTEVSRKVERLYCYASQRHDEDAETFSTGFSMDTASLAEPTTGETIATLRQWSEEYRLALAGSYKMCIRDRSTSI